MKAAQRLRAEVGLGCGSREWGEDTDTGYS